MNKEKWEIKKLGEIAIVSSGQSAPQNKSYFGSIGIPFVRAGNLEELINGSNEQNLLKIKKDIADKYKLKQYPIGSVLFAKSGMSAQLNRIHVLKADCYIVSHIAILQLKKELPTYIKYYLRYNPPSNLIKDEGYPSISLSDIQSLKIPIPPLSTQEKIVSELDTLHRLKELQEQQLAELDNLAQSTFYDLFGDPIENEKGWEVKKLGEFTRIINGRAYKQEELLKEGKTPVLRVGNFFSNKDFYYSNLELDKDKYCDYGDLLYAWSASFGAKIWDGGKVIYHYHIWKIEINESICNKIFLFNILNLKTNYLKEQTHGIAMLHLTKSGMEDTNFILPPLSLQTQFSERIEKIETQKELIKQSIDETQLLIDYTMDKYFG